MTGRPPNGTIDPTARRLGQAAAALFLVGLLTGIYAGLAMSGKIPVHGGAALASHLNALMGAFLLVSLGWTLPMLHYGPAGKSRLATVFIATTYANWLITAVKAALHVSGIDLNGKLANDAVFVGLQLAVVIPALIGAIAWVFGFRSADTDER
jgi:hydroxylaminobenzene mutase